MYSDISVHTNDSIIYIPKKVLKNTYIRATAEKDAEIMKRQALEKEYNKIIEIKRRESEKICYLEKNMNELKKEIEEYKSSSSNKIIEKKKIEIETSSESESESSSESDTETSNESSSESSSEIESMSYNAEQKNKILMEKIKNSEQIIKENKEKLVDEYYKKHYASKIDMLKKGLGGKI